MHPNMLININNNEALKSKPRFAVIKIITVIIIMLLSYYHAIMGYYCTLRSCRGHALIIVTKNGTFNKTSYCNPSKLNRCFIYENTCGKGVSIFKFCDD